MNKFQYRSTRRQLLKVGAAGALLAAAPVCAQSVVTKPGAEKASEGAAAGQADSISPAMRTVSTYIAQALTHELPDAVTEASKHHVLDTLSAMVSGSQLPPGRKAIAYVKSLGGTKEACVPGTRIITNTVNAALAGAMMAHADETDDSHAPSHTHPGCGIIPAALAVAERQRCGGVAFLRAVALGYDIGTRVAMTLGFDAFDGAGHDTHSFGTMFGAAAACASLAGLSAEQVRYALSYTSQQASGLSNFARDSQHIEKAFIFAGMPARNGAAAATMVASGMTGIEDSFSGDRNFFFAFGVKDEPLLLTRGLGETFEIANTNIKRWTVGSPIQAPLDSLSYLVKTYKIKAHDVKKVVVRISQYGARTVDDRGMPDISLQHLAAVMLLDGTVTFESAHDYKRMKDPQVLALRSRIELLGDDEMERVLPSRQARVELTLNDGRVLQHHTINVRGTAQNPMTRDEVEEKSYSLLAPVLGTKRARALIDAIWHIETKRDVRELRPLLTA